MIKKRTNKLSLVNFLPQFSNSSSYGHELICENYGKISVKTKKKKFSVYFNTAIKKRLQVKRIEI